YRAWPGFVPALPAGRRNNEGEPMNDQVDIHRRDFLRSAGLGAAAVTLGAAPQALGATSATAPTGNTGRGQAGLTTSCSSSSIRSATSVPANIRPGFRCRGTSG